MLPLYAVNRLHARARQCTCVSLVIMCCARCARNSTYLICFSLRFSDVLACCCDPEHTSPGSNDVTAVVQCRPCMKHLHSKLAKLELR